MKLVTLIYEDNQGCIAMAGDPVKHGRTKHIDIRYHYVWDMILAGEIFVIYCPSEEMIADVLTKPLNGDKFDQMVKWLGLQAAMDTV